MTKSEFISRLAARVPRLMVGDCRVAVDTIFEALATTLASGDRVEIRGFGAFGIRYHLPRTARNPKTGTTVAVLGKAVPYFKAGKLLRETVATVANRRAPSHSSGAQGNGSAGDEDRV